MDPQSPSKEYPHPSLSGQPSPAPSVSQNAGIKYVQALASIAQLDLTMSFHSAQIGEIKGQPSLDITGMYLNVEFRFSEALIEISLLDPAIRAIVSILVFVNSLYT